MYNTDMISYLQKLFQKKKKTKIHMIVAIDEERGIGKNTELLFSIKKDMQHFTEKTTDGVVIMGSTTYESIPQKFRPLKNRINIILHREKIHYPGKNVFVVHSISEAIKKAENFQKKIWVMGGASIYQQMLPFTHEIELTQIVTRKKADTFFPEFKKKFYIIKKSEKFFDGKEQVYYQFQTWKRK